MITKPTIVALAAALATGTAHAELNSSTSLSLNSARSFAEPSGEPAISARKGDSFGIKRAEGYDWNLILGGGVARNAKSDTDLSLNVGFSTFVFDGLEMIIEPGAWYFSQKGKDTGGVSLSFAARYHWFPMANGTGSRARDWSIFGEAGIGVLATIDDTPVGGTRFNFLPRAGAGVTFPIGNDGLRLVFAVRWHHVSNARISGNANNVTRNGVMFAAGIEMPWPW